MYKRLGVDGREDVVAVEEPLEIRVDGKPLAVTMRTPAHDEELALGFLHGEGLIAESRRATLGPELESNVIEIEGPLLYEPGERNFYATSSCGVCGKGAIEQVRVDADAAAAGPVVSRDLVAGLPQHLSQPAFELTGGLHATGLFTGDGDLVCSREDVGRHNSMDKVVGWALGAGKIPLHDHILCVSGRLSFELVQKAAVAGAPILVGVGAPSSLAISLADELGMTLAGFARGGTVNVYCDDARIS
jgi:FdhD protein